MIRKGAVLAALGVAITACGTTASPSPRSAHGVTVKATSSSPAGLQSGWVQAVPGHQTPADAADGFMQGMNAGKPAEACGFMEPNLHSSCLKALSGLRRKETQFNVNGQAVSGSEALVGVAGQLVLSSLGVTSTETYDAPPITAGSTFRKMYQIMTTQLDPNFKVLLWTPLAPIPCAEISGQWYVGPYSSVAFNNIKQLIG